MELCKTCKKTLCEKNMEIIKQGNLVTIRCLDYEKDANRLIDQLVTKRLEIENAIKSVRDDAQREVLERRYLLFQRWESRFDGRTGEYIKGIAESMGYSERQIYRLHGKALKNVSVNVSESQL